MKHIKKSLIATALVLSFAGNVLAFEPSAEIEEFDRGPFETYKVCVDSCISRTSPSTSERVACGADCYIKMVADIFKLFA
jgi:hypothetical protein